MRLWGGDGKGELKHDELESSILDDVEDKLILEPGLCSSSFRFLLLDADVIECASRGG